MTGATECCEHHVLLHRRIGVATLFGSILMLDLRLLGLWRNIPLLPKADIRTAVQNVRLVPIADSYQSFLRLFSVTFGQQRVDFKICLLG